MLNYKQAMYMLILFVDVFVILIHTYWKCLQDKAAAYPLCGKRCIMKYVYNGILLQIGFENKEACF